MSIKKGDGLFSAMVYLLHNTGVAMSLIYSLDEGTRPPAVLFGFVACAIVSLCVYFKRLMWLLVPWGGILIWAMAKGLSLQGGCWVMIAAIGLVALSVVFVCLWEFQRFRRRCSCHVETM